MRLISFLFSLEGTGMNYRAWEQWMGRAGCVAMICWWGTPSTDGEHWVVGRHKGGLRRYTFEPDRWDLEVPYQLVEMVGLVGTVG